MTDTNLLPEHFEIASRLPPNEAGFFFMRVYRALWLAKMPATTYQRSLMTHIVNSQPSSALK